MTQSSMTEVMGRRWSAIQEASSVLVESLVSDEASIANLDESAMESRPSPADHERTVLGRYWRRAPLAFSLLARCRGYAGRRRTPAPPYQREPHMLSHLLALVPGQRATQPLREPTHGRGQGRANLLGPPASRQGHQRDRSAGPLDQGQHGRGALAEHQVAFPVSRDLAPICLGGPLVDRDGVEELASSLGQALAARVAHRLRRGAKPHAGGGRSSRSHIGVGPGGGW